MPTRFHDEIMNTLWILILLIFVQCTATRNHLIVDAGSTGTRFCPFAIEKNESGCKIKSSSSCTASPSKKGLADQNAEEIEQTFKNGLSDFHNPDKVTVLGTGGFRRLSEGDQLKASRSINETLKKTGIPYQFIILRGEDEGILTHRSIQLNTGNHQLTMIEIGGATIQIATGSRANIKARSFPFGINELAKIKKSTPDSICKDGWTLCLQTLQGILSKDASYSSFTQELKKQNTNLLLYLTGGPSRVAFEKVKKNKITADEIEKEGKETCGQKNNKECYFLAYQFLLMKNLNYHEAESGNTSFAPGAAVYEQYFPYCKI